MLVGRTIFPEFPPRIPRSWSRFRVSRREVKRGARRRTARALDSFEQVDLLAFAAVAVSLAILIPLTPFFLIALFVWALIRMTSRPVVHPL